TYLVHARPARAWVRADSTNIAVGTETPDFSSDTTIHAGPEIRLLLAGTMSASDALASGAVEVEGPPHSLATFCRAFHVPLEDSELVIDRSEEHTSELQSRFDLVCRLLLEKKYKYQDTIHDVDELL